MNFTEALIKLRDDIKTWCTNNFLAVKESIVQSDYAQNDTTASDYIKNRTHWVEYEAGTLTFDGDFTGKTTIPGTVFGYPGAYTLVKVLDRVITESEVESVRTVMVKASNVMDGLHEKDELLFEIFENYENSDLNFLICQSSSNNILFLSILKSTIYNGHTVEQGTYILHAEQNGIKLFTSEINGVLLETAVHKLDEKYLPDSVKNVQPDYVQNDPTAPDYIKNRLAWTDYSEAEILPETTITIVQSEYIQESVIGLQEGFSYIVNWNGISYKCVCSKVSDGESEAFVLGNLGILGAGGDTGEPFVMMDDPVNNIFGVVAAEDADYTVSITEFSETVHRIDPKYLPKGGFGYDEGNIIIFDETITVSGGSYLYQTLGLVEGRTYVVNIDGVKYECVCKSIITDNGTFNYIGNDRIMGLENNTGESFCIVDSPEQEISAISLMQEDLSEAVPDGDYHIIINDSQIHKIDEKFLPTVTIDTIDGLQEELNWKLELVPQTKYAETALPNASWQSVAYGNDKFVVVSDSDIAAYSTDGINWTEVTMPLRSCSSVAYGDGKFVVVSEVNTQSAYSTDGITWTAVDMPVYGCPSVTYGDGKFVVIGNVNTSAYSTDGINWTKVTMPESINGIWYSVTYGDGKFVVVNNMDTQSAYSIDGITWTAVDMPVYFCSSVTYGNGKFVAISNTTNGVAYTEDCITWTEVDTTLYQNLVGAECIAYGNDKFVVVSDSDIAAYSTDGINWTEVTMPDSPNGGWKSVTYGDGKFVAVTNSPVAAYSTDGVNWIESTKTIEYNIITQNEIDITEDTALAVKDYLSITDIAKIETAEVGQTLVVKSVDENGRPTEWETVDLGSMLEETAPKVISFDELGITNILLSLFEQGGGVHEMNGNDIWDELNGIGESKSIIFKFTFAQFGNAFYSTNVTLVRNAATGEVSAVCFEAIITQGDIMRATVRMYKDNDNITTIQLKIAVL